jgi:hypothetical protein
MAVSGSFGVKNVRFRGSGVRQLAEYNSTPIDYDFYD